MPKTEFTADNKRIRELESNIRQLRQLLMKIQDGGQMMITNFFGAVITEINPLKNLFLFLKFDHKSDFLMFWREDGEYLEYRVVKRNSNGKLICYEYSIRNITLEQKGPKFCDACDNFCKTNDYEMAVC